MSYDVSLNCPHCARSLPVDAHTEGGTYVAGGSTEADLNITYNYAGDFRSALGYDGTFRDYINGKRGAEVIPALEAAVKQLGIERYSDYWKATPGNAGYALNILLAWAKQHPDGIFSVS